jgi:DNA polymerase III subunit gamma/tau
MSDYIVTARKWRPMRFEDVVGQLHVTRTLRNAITSNRLAHAYLFSGPRGVGKTTTARLLAKAVNCRAPQDANPDNLCDICKEITDGTSFDVLEIDGASNRGIDEIRNLRDSVRYAPAKGNYKVYIIDEVHMLTKESFNALLKTLEEPPSQVMFIFATTEIHKVPATILSRCQRFDFRRISLEEIIGNLRAIAKEEQLEIDDESLLIVARKGDGSLRDAQSIFDQVVSLCGRAITHQAILQALNMVDQEVYFRVTDLIKNRDPKGALELVENLLGQGHDMKEFLAGLLEHFRNILLVKTTGSSRLLEFSDVYKKKYEDEAALFGIADLLRFQRHINGTESALRYTIQPRFRLEADLVQLVTLPRAAEIADVIQGIEDLKKKLGEGPLTGQARGKDLSATGGPGQELPRKPAVAGRSFGASAHKQDPAPATASSVVEGRGLSEAEVRSRWQEVLAEVRRQRISLNAVLEAAVLTGVTGNVVHIAFADDFHVSHIHRNREFLSALISKVLNATARLEAKTDPDAVARVSGETPPLPRKESEAEEHPVLAALKRELGAEPLD